MRNFLLPALLIISFYSCSDGDLQIETIDFDSATIQNCTDPVAESSNVLFKISEDEALIMELQNGALNNGVVGETVTTESTVPSQTKLTYRIFSENVTSSYFCDDIPPVTPTVTDEIEAGDGMVIIETVADEENNNFVHTISLSGISFITESGERITNLSINEFGEVTTAIPN
ncbi:hypothetical protein [Flagellimonas nanhaiensis]|uniref:Uncharacterized protein n=1 Tax=Flagellimonas nanhaiensis TaxID=2292706 RepID=A0A371JTC2_9FLAO|nr:hypothetical protein [Allomuricauda nanhaiensis]RDY61026.1 hypothetical protein DX873_02275 [Allomuricauda nanhaiensis]